MQIRLLAFWIGVLVCVNTIAAQQHQRDYGYYSLSGKVKSISESLIINSSINHIPGNGDTVYSHHYAQHKYSFNQEGNLTESVEYFSDSSVAGIGIYTYDPSGNHLASIRFINSARVESRSINYEYDSAGNLISERIFRYGDISESIKYSYDQKHQLLESVSLNHNGSLNRRTMYGYDKRGNKTSQTDFGSNDSLNSRVLFEFDKRGNIISEKKYDSRDSLEHKTYYIYRRGRVIGSSYFYDGKLRSFRIIGYDKKGDKTSEIRYSFSNWSDKPLTEIIRFNNGLIASTKQYNHSGALIRSEENEYDSHNNLTRRLSREAPGFIWQQDGTTVLKTTFDYDSRTGISTETEWFQDGNPYMIRRHDSDSNLIEVLQYEQDLVLKSRQVWVYDSAGRLKEKALYSDIDGNDTLSAEVFIYQTEGEQKDTGEIEANDTKAILHKYIYDLTGNISESCVIRLDGSVAELSVFTKDSTTGITEEERKWYNRDGTIQHHWILNFDTRGNQLYRAAYLNSKQEFVPFETAQYDENNNVIEEVYYSYDRPSGTTKSITRRLYNEAGLITELHRFDTRSDSIKPYAKTVYNYNSAGKIEKIATHDRDDILTNQTVYNYDNEGQLVQMSQNNFRISPTHHHGYHSTITTYRYDSLGNLTHQVGSCNNTITSELIFEYDAEGNIIREKNYSGGILMREKINEYDNSGRRTEAIEITYLGEELDEDGMINTIIEYRREYDANGNWTAMDYIRNGKITRCKIRAIEYYD